jgi:hypothetical protein
VFAAFAQDLGRATRQIPDLPVHEWTPSGKAETPAFSQDAPIRAISFLLMKLHPSRAGGKMQRSSRSRRKEVLKHGSSSERLRELSIRVALGAQAKQIFSAALGRMLILLACGSIVGLILGVAASRVLSAIVYQASAQDPFVLAAVPLTILPTGSLSLAGPVPRRALHVDPVELQREQ